MCFGDPWEGDVPIAQVVAVARRLLDLGCQELSIGDTIGTGTPGHVAALLDTLRGTGDNLTSSLAVHFHDTYGQALANVYAALECGITTVDASAGGLGGCPFASSATGNVATEDVLWQLDGLGVETGVDLRAVAEDQRLAQRLPRPTVPVTRGARHRGPPWLTCPRFRSCRRGRSRISCALRCGRSSVSNSPPTSDPASEWAGAGTPSSATRSPTGVGSAWRCPWSTADRIGAPSSALSSPRSCWRRARRIAAHWVADRQTGPMILHHGTEEQRRRFLPEITAGRCSFSIGMSEPDAGSDLAAVRTTATPVDGGWRLSGTKIWTSHTSRSDYVVALCRTGPAGDDRHRGLSQLFVDTSSPGVEINKIRFLDGTDDFDEVVFGDVFVPDDMVLGEPGAGWAQVASELVLDAADRPPVSVSCPATTSSRTTATVTTTSRPWAASFATLWTIRQLGMSVAWMVDHGEATPQAASLVKDLGTRYEQQVVDVIAELAALDPDPSATDVFESLLAEAVVVAPSFTIPAAEPRRCCGS